jgi:hypothetical protein
LKLKKPTVWGKEMKAMIETFNLWRPIEDAPPNQKMVVWGNGPMRFMRKDDRGQWRNAQGRPKGPPKLWYDLPRPPVE